MLSSIEKEQGKYREALAYYEQYNTLSIKIYQDIQERSVAGLQEKYALALVNNAHQQLTIRHQQTNRLLLFVLIALIVTAFAFYYYHTKKKAALLNKDKTLKNTLIQSFDMVRKLSVLEATLNQEDRKTGAKLLHRFKEIVFNTQDGNYWQNFYHIIDNYYNGQLHILKENYPLLDEDEFKVCCLCLANFKNDEMAAFLGFSINTIQATKTGIRKKLHLEERGDIKAFLEQKIAGLSTQ